MLNKTFGKHRNSQENKSPKSSFFYTSDSGQRISVKRRGKRRYFCYIQERYSDIYCFVSHSIGIPLMKDNFQIEECVFVDNNFDNVKDFLTNLSRNKKKSITFSLNSVKPF